MDGDEELPDEQSSKADEQNGPHHWKQDHQDVRALGTLCQERAQSRVVGNGTGIIRIGYK